MSFKTGFTEQLGRIAAATVVEIATKFVHKLVVKPASNESRDHNLSDEEIADRETLESEGHLNNTISQETLDSIAQLFREYDEKDDENIDNDEKEN